MWKMGNRSGFIKTVTVVFACTILASAAIAQDGNWITLINDKDMSQWRVGMRGKWLNDKGDWVAASDVSLDAENKKALVWKPASDDESTLAYVNGKAGKTQHLSTKLEHGDVEAHVEFMVPQGSNSGVYFMGRYEIQVFDSWDSEKNRPKENPTYSDAGGIYERWKDNKGYEGHAPRVSVSRAPGEWQSFDVIFRAPRFDANGKKIENAKFVKVIHNGRVVHENVEVTGPTRAADFDDEKPTGPLMLQGDHGPVAYANVRIRKIEEKTVWERLPKYEFGDDREDLLAVEDDIRSASDDRRRAIEANLIDVLNSQDATYAAKQFCCRALFQIGTARSVPALAKLLKDDKLSHMARYALERMPAPEAGAALRDALGGVEGQLEVGVINSIAGRGDRQAVPTLAELAKNNDAAVASAAIAALGSIGGRQATRALAELQPAKPCLAVWADAYMKCADRMAARDRKANAVAIYKKILAERISAPTQIAAIQGLVKAEDKSAVPEIEKAAESDDPSVQTAAKAALEALK